MLSLVLIIAIYQVGLRFLCLSDQQLNILREKLQVVIYGYHIFSAGELKSCATYLDLLNEISTAAMFIGNDSGPGHLAGIIGVPTVVLFGPTDPAQWRPLGPRGNVLSAPIIEDLQVDDVVKLVE